jgi:catechol 2,3-dioxygenase-like lactoylglutathione lyase family enzyme
MRTHLRIARPTNDLSALLPFYQQGLGFEIIDSFEDHEGFDGLMLGHPHEPYHLEFTRQCGHRVECAPTQEHLLVFYLPDLDAWKSAVQRVRDNGFEPVPAFNPFWDVHGKTFEDPDGYRVVVQNAGWTNEKPTTSQPV